MGHSKMHMKMKGHKKGGRVFYDGGESNVAKEERAEKKGGGRVEGHKGKSRMKKARGGSCDANPFSSAHRG